jgi:hypothetical protein
MDRGLSRRPVCRVPRGRPERVHFRAREQYLGGETYAIIPSSLLPRLFFPEKASPHYASSTLNVHYGNQTWESSQSTTIGWGLLNESFANFGHLGWVGLALCLGAFYGLITRLSIGLPSASIQSLVGIFTMGFAMQTEWTASVFITAYAQGLFSFLIVAFTFARRIRTGSFGVTPESAAVVTEGLWSLGQIYGDPSVRAENDSHP